MPSLNATRFRLAVLGVVALLAGAAACTESIEAGDACPVLCPTENEAVRDTVLEAVSLDTTLAGYPFPGDAPLLLVALRPGADSVDVRSVIRFDSLPARYFPASGADSLPITSVDSSYLRLRVDTATLRVGGEVRLEAYDVDTAAAVDTAVAALSALFRPDRFLGAVTLTPGGLTTDSLRVPLSNAAVAAKMVGRQRLRIGLRLAGTTAAQIRVGSAQGGVATAGPSLLFDPAPDATYTPIILAPTSSTPEASAEVSIGLQDFTFAARGTRAPAPTDLRVGGVPGRRTYVQFAVPARLSDSTTIVRAVLRLVQRPAYGAAATDTVVVLPDLVVASSSITDLRRVIDLTSAGSLIGVDSVRVVPTDSGTRDLSLVNVVRSWRVLPPGTPRAIVLRAAREGAQLGEFRFFSAEAPAGLRPRLQISYIPRSNFGLP